MSDDFGGGDFSDSGADSYTETSTEGWGSRIGGSIVAALIGLLLVPVAIVLLYWNEGRAVDAIRALDRGAKSIVEVAATPLDLKADGKLVHVTGMLQPGTPARDPVFGVTADGLVRLSRKVEMFQWEEQSKTETHENIGGSKTTTTTYTYRRAWLDHPVDSNRFHGGGDHRNPPMPDKSQIFDAADVTLGAYKVDHQVLDRLSAFTAIQNPAAPPPGYMTSGSTFYHGQNPADPRIGDVRVTFSGIAAQTVSVAAAATSGILTPWRDANGYTIALAEPGTVPAATLFAEEKKAEGTLTWILRGVGFVVVLVGFLFMARPLTILFAVLPFLESIVGAGAFLAAVTLSVPVTLVTIAIAWIAHRPVIGVGLLVAAVAGLFLLGRIGPRRRRPGFMPGRS
jgi:Transmembrane protein 43